MPRYVTASEAAAYMGISDSNPNIASIVESAEAIFDVLANAPGGLMDAERRDEFTMNDCRQPPYKRDRVFFLRSYLPTSIETVDGEDPGTSGTDYHVRGQRLELKEAPTINLDAFPCVHVIVYRAGFADTASVPNDIKTAVKMMAALIYQTKNAAGIASVRQDLLTVQYKDGGGAFPMDSIFDPTSASVVRAIAARYSVPQTYS